VFLLDCSPIKPIDTDPPMVQRRWIFAADEFLRRGLEELQEICSKPDPQVRKWFPCYTSTRNGWDDAVVHLKQEEIEAHPRSIWAEAMRATVAVARRSLKGEDAMLHAVSDELQRLEMTGFILLLRDDGLLELRGAPSDLEERLIRLTGVDVRGYRFDPQKVDAYKRVLNNQEPAFAKCHMSILDQVVPKATRPLTGKLIDALGNQPIIYAPLCVEEKVLGVMNVSADWFTMEDVPMVASLADHIAINLSHMRTSLEFQSILMRERLRTQVAEVVTHFWDLEKTLDRIFRLIADEIGADAGSIGLIEPGGQNLRLHHLYSLPESLGETGIPRNQGLAWIMIEDRKPVIHNDYAQHPDALQEWVDAGVRAVIGAPLISGDEIIGTMALFRLEEGKEFDQNQLDILIDISHIAAGVIHNVQLFNEATRYAEQAEALRRGSIAISSSLDYHTVLTEITEQAKSLLRADGSRVHLLDQESGMLKCVIALHPHADRVMQLELKPGEGLSGYVLKTGEPLLVNRPTDHPHSVQVPGTPQDEEEVLAIVPLKIRRHIMGVMTVQRNGYGRPFSESDIRLLNAFASQAAVAIENAHLYGQIETQAQQLEDEVMARTRQLALSEARYRSLVETSLTGIYQLDNDARVTYANDQLAEMLELKPEEIIGRSVVDFLAPKNRELIFKRAVARLRGEEPPTDVYEVELLSWSGRHIPVIVAAGVIFDEEGEPESISGLVLDISTQKRLEAALRMERDRLGVILGNVGDAVVVTDPGGMIDFVNPAWEHLNGYSAKEALGKNANLVKSDAHDRDFYFQMWDTILAGRVWRGEVVNQRKDGSTYEAALTITPVKNESDQIINFVGVQHDISILKELDRLKSQFVSDVSHELRTPLTNIRLYLDLLTQTEYDQRAQSYMDTLSRESERLSSLIEDLLSLSRLEADTAPLNKEPVDLNRMLSTLTQDRERLASQYGLDLRFECEANLPLVMGDALLLSQLFTNLLTNALNYTPEGGDITIRTRSQSSEETIWVIVDVEDTGYGIQPFEQSLIFRRFFRGQASKPSMVPGTGLGLAICKEISERHGGKIMVASDGILGHGSQFTVWLPVT
jgi:PAS domain S-box-containing protein